MKKFLVGLCVCLLSFGLAVQDAEARRLGGGASRGIQRQMAPSPSPPARQAAPTAPNAYPPAAAPAPAPGKRSWLGPLAGLAAGLGIGALLSHFGMGEGMGDILVLVLLAMAAMFIFKRFLQRPQLQAAGAGGPPVAPAPGVSRFEPMASPATAAAAPAAAEPAGNIPADFDAEGFLRIAKVNFVRLQAANDAANLEDIREFTTPEMFAEIKVDIDVRRGATQQTDVVTLEAELLEVAAEPTRHIASVRFHGMIREEKDGAAQGFSEIWHLVKPMDGSRGWVIGGIQQLN